MILPQYQNYGYGRFLIEFSYLLSKEEKSLGTPEKPLSELGKISYLNYWKYKIVNLVNDKHSQSIYEISIKDISDETSMTPADILYALNQWKIIKPRAGEKEDSIHVSKKDIEKVKRPRLKVEPKNLRWTKYLSPYQPREKLLNTDEETNIESGSEPENNL